jgi:hypothetical protein
LSLNRKTFIPASRALVASRAAYAPGTEITARFAPFSCARASSSVCGFEVDAGETPASR